MNAEKNKESELGKQIAIELTNINKWPTIQEKTNIPEPTLPMSAIITLAMIEEAHCKGSFQARLDKACEENHFPKFKYDLKHEAAVMVVKNLSANPGAIVSFPTPNPHTQTMNVINNQIGASQQISSPYNQTVTHSPNQTSFSQPLTSQPTSLRYIRDMRKHLAASYNEAESDSNASEGSNRNKRARYSPNKTTNQGALNDIRSRLEEQTYIINVEDHSHIGTGIEEFEVKDLLELYTTSNSELSATRRKVIEALLSQAVAMDRYMNVNANIIRVGEDFS